MDERTEVARYVAVRCRRGVTAAEQLDGHPWLDGMLSEFLMDEFGLERRRPDKGEAPRGRRGRPSARGGA